MCVCVCILYLSKIGIIFSEMPSFPCSCYFLCIIDNSSLSNVQNIKLGNFFCIFMFYYSNSAKSVKILNYK